MLRECVKFVEMKWLQRYTGFFRRVRLFHFIYNLIHWRGLEHNKRLYPAFGIKKSVYRSISSKDFTGKQAKLPWLDYPIGTTEITSHPDCQHFDIKTTELVSQWHKNGFVILEQFFSETIVDEINASIDSLLEAEKLRFNYTGRKIFNAFEFSDVVHSAIHDKQLTTLLSFILGKKVFPFQTINFQFGSEQKAHSDSVHMTTFPKGYLIAAWIALEDISEDAGPIFYYPGSNQLPYLTNEDYGADNNFFLLDGEANKKYEAKIEELVESKNLTPQTFLAKKGDIFIWHANLVHGGSPVLDKNKTRKSMVVHYFAEDVICYHEISERPAIINFETKDLTSR